MKDSYELAWDLIRDCLKDENNFFEFPIIAVSPEVLVALGEQGLEWKNERPYFFDRLIELADGDTDLWEFRRPMGKG
jgi:hypothetical protein